MTLIAAIRAKQRLEKKNYREKLYTVLEDFDDGISHRSLCVSYALYRGWEKVILSCLIRTYYKEKRDYSCHLRIYRQVRKIAKRYC